MKKGGNEGWMDTCRRKDVPVGIEVGGERLEWGRMMMPSTKLNYHKYLLKSLAASGYLVSDECRAGGYGRAEEWRGRGGGC